MSATQPNTMTEIEIEDVQQIKRELNFLMRRYARSSSQDLAEKIYMRMEGLLPHLEKLGFQEHRCAYYRLLRCWRLKANDLETSH